MLHKKEWMRFPVIIGVLMVMLFAINLPVMSESGVKQDDTYTGEDEETSTTAPAPSPTPTAISTETSTVAPGSATATDPTIAPDVVLNQEPIVIIEDEEIPAGPAILPGTGGIPALVVYGLGGILAVSGIILRKKK